MVRSCGTAFAVLGTALFTAACSSSARSAASPSSPAQAKAPSVRHDPLSVRTPARTTASVAPATRPTPAGLQAAPAARPSTPISRCALAPAPSPAPREATVAVRAINATCPVLVGTPVDPTITTRWKGSTIAFSSTTARLMWETDPSRYSANVAGLSGSAGDSEAAFAKLAPAAGPAAASGMIVPTSPAVGARVVSGAAVASPVVASAPAPKPAPAVAVPAAAPAHADGEECEECPGGVCRVPGR